MGRQSECVGDQLVGCSLSLLYVAALILGTVGLSICPDRYELWRDSRPDRSGDDTLGKPARRPLLHSEPLARSYYHVGNRSTFYVRLVARHALWQHRFG